MKSLGNLGGTLWYYDMPLFTFKFQKGHCIYYEQLGDKKWFPEELMRSDDVQRDLATFFIDRATPATRQGINELLRDCPIKYYDIERMTRDNHGQCIHDSYWLEQDIDISCWKHTELEETGVEPVHSYNDLPVMSIVRPLIHIE